MQENKTKNSARFINGFPFIKSHSNISANILSLDTDIDYTNRDNIRLIEEYTKAFLENNISSYLYTTAKNFRSDIVRIWQICSSSFLDYSEI